MPKKKAEKPKKGNKEALRGTPDQVQDTPPVGPEILDETTTKVLATMMEYAGLALAGALFATQGRRLRPIARHATLAALKHLRGRAMELPDELQEVSPRQVVTDFLNLTEASVRGGGGGGDEEIDPLREGEG